MCVSGIRAAVPGVCTDQGAGAATVPGAAARRHPCGRHTLRQDAETGGY